MFSGRSIWKPTLFRTASTCWLKTNKQKNQTDFLLVLLFFFNSLQIMQPYCLHLAGMDHSYHPTLATPLLSGHQPKTYISSNPKACESQCPTQSYFPHGGKNGGWKLGSYLEQNNFFKLQDFKNIQILKCTHELKIR